MEDVTTIKVCETCRRIRLAVVALFIISSGLAGMFWGHVGQGDNKALVWAIVCTGVSVVLILGIEIVVTKVELEAKRLYLQLKAATEEARLQQEKINQLNRSLDLLAKDDDDVRRQLMDEHLRRMRAEQEGNTPAS